MMRSNLLAGGPLFESLELRQLLDGDPGIDVEPLLDAVGPNSVSGAVYVDANNNGVRDSGEVGIANVKIILSANGQPDRIAHTDGDGNYFFGGLGDDYYTLVEEQPAGYLDGKDGPYENDRYTGVVLSEGAAGTDFNFGERAIQQPVQPPINPNPEPKPSPTPALAGRGSTASIEFWHARGQTLIRSLNGSAKAHNLGDWLARSFPALFGQYAFRNNLAGKSNAYVADFFQKLYSNAKGRKVEAEVMALALSCYVTNRSLAGTIASTYGFKVSTRGTGAALFSIGRAALCFGTAKNARLTGMQILQITNSRTNMGAAYCQDSILRALAADSYHAINAIGGIN